METDMEITLDDLQEQHREIAEVIGVDNMLRLAEVFGGSSIYIPQRRELVKNKIYSAIYKEYDGANIKKLASKYQVSESMIYKIVKDKIGRIGVPGQMSFDDYGI